MPLLDGRLVALRGPLDGSLHAPARLAQQATDMIGVVVHAKGALNHRGAALGRPHVAAKAVRRRPAGQQAGDLRPLLRGQFRGAAQMRPTTQRRRSSAFASALDPLAHCRAADPQGGDIFLPPPRLRQLPRASASPLADIG
jgi:hypothetical protein